MTEFFVVAVSNRSGKITDRNVVGDYFESREEANREADKSNQISKEIWKDKIPPVVYLVVEGHHEVGEQLLPPAEDYISAKEAVEIANSGCSKSMPMYVLNSHGQVCRTHFSRRDYDGYDVWEEKGRPTPITNEELKSLKEKALSVKNADPEKKDTAWAVAFYW